MHINFLCPNSFECWDWRNPDNPGIGGSETAVVELSRRLAKRGHQVNVFAKIRKDTTADGPVNWLPLKHAKPNNEKWIVCRSPKSAEFGGWLQCQDVYYSDPTGGGDLTAERAARFNRILALCPVHQDYLKTTYPFAADKICLSSNGIKSDAIRQLPKVQRDPFRLIWTSSPDRGLETLLRIFARAREFEPRLNLHIFYGWDNINRVIKLDPNNQWSQLKKRITQPQENVFWHGRLGQQALWTEYLQSNIWCYPTTFTETSCISCMEAQALGVIPICPPLWALQHNVAHGISIPGDANEPLNQSRYLGAILKLANNPPLCQAIRQEMRPWALEKFNWENVVDQYEGWLC